MKNHFFSALWLAGSLSQAVAQSTPTLPLDKAITLALQNNKSLKIADTRVKAAEARLQAAKDHSLPQATASLAYSHYNLISPFTIAGSDASKPLFSIPAGAFDATLGGVTISKEIIGGMAERSSRLSADLLAQASRLDVESNRSELVYTVTAAYYNIVKLMRSSEIVAQNIRQFDEREKEAKNLLKEGIVTANEVLQVQLQRNNLQLSQLELDKAQQTALYNLSLLIGVADQAPISVDTSLTTSAITLAPVTEYLSQALQVRPELKANALRVKAAEATLTNAKSIMYPHLGVTGGYNYINPTRKLLPDNASYVSAWNVGLGLSYNIGSLYNMKGKLNEAKNTITQTDLQGQQEADQIRNEVVSAYNNYELTLEKENVIKTALTQAQENYRLAESRFRNGLILSSDLLEANAFLIQSQLNALNAAVDAQLAYQQLLKATGTLTK